MILSRKAWGGGGGRSTRKHVPARTVGRVSIKFGEHGGYGSSISSMSQGSAKPLWVTITCQNREVFGRVSWFLATASFLKSTWSGERAGFLGRFPKGLEALDGRMLLTWAPALTAQGLYSIMDLGKTVFLFLHDVTFEKRGLGRSN